MSPAIVIFYVCDVHGHALLHTVGHRKIGAGYESDGLSARKDYCLVGAVVKEKGFEVQMLGLKYTF